MPSTITRRTRRVLEFGGGSRASPKYATALTGNFLGRRLARALTGGRKISYIGIDPGNVEHALKLKSNFSHVNPTGQRRAKVVLRHGSLLKFPYPFRTGSVDEVHFHMIPAMNNMSNNQIEQLSRELSRVLRTRGRVYFTGQGLLDAKGSQLLMHFYRQKKFRIRYLTTKPTESTIEVRGKENQSLPHQQSKYSEKIVDSFSQWKKYNSIIVIMEKRATPT